MEPPAIAAMNIRDTTCANSDYMIALLVDQCRTRHVHSRALKTRTLRRGQDLTPCLLIWTLLGFSALTPAAEESRTDNARRDTNMTITLSPNGETLAVGLMGQLWWWPLNSGDAKLLKPLEAPGFNPHFSPDGKQIVYQRYIAGQWDLWRLDIENRTQYALTGPPYNDREPTYTLDGSIVFVSDRAGSFDVWTLDPTSNDLSLLTTQPSNASFPSMSELGDLAYVSQHGDTWTLKVLTTQGVLTNVYTSRHPLHAPSWRPGGGALLFNELLQPNESSLMMLIFGDTPVLKDLTTIENVPEFRVAWVSSAEFLYTAHRRIWRRGLTNTQGHPLILPEEVSRDTGTR